jgi:hypothetical protein
MTRKISKRPAPSGTEQYLFVCGVSVWEGIDTECYAASGGSDVNVRFAGGDGGGQSRQRGLIVWPCQ